MFNILCGVPKPVIWLPEIIVRGGAVHTCRGSIHSELDSPPKIKAILPMSELETSTPGASAIALVDGQSAMTEPQPYCDAWQSHGPTKLLSSSVDRGWSGLSAELRAHGKGVVPWRGAPSDTEICVGIRGGMGSLITRQAAGMSEQTVARRDMVWLTPAGWQKGSVEFADDVPEVVHIYLPPSQFSPSKLGIESDHLVLGALRYENAFRDPLLGGVARAIASELKSETSAGKLLVESLANSMAVRLVQNHVSTPAAETGASHARGGLDRHRLFRVLDYIEANLEGDLSLDGMASIACLSRYHFARAFRQSVGQSPHRYLSARRLERAKALLRRGDRTLVDIALALSFSSQANFTRAFRQATGQAPGRYRQTAGGSGTPAWRQQGRLATLNEHRTSFALETI
ncbi:AraC family transcriptional regulator [Bradyrhizobium sp. UFLA05-109]